MPAFLPAALVDGYLRKIESMGLSALAKVPEIPQFKRQVRLFLAARREKF
jgi:hypothetical protein